MEKENTVLVTVMCLCYNHEKYIRQCLDSIVCQKTTFDFMVLVHDDASTDKSADIIREYEQKFPGLVKGIFEEENLYSRKGFLGIQRKMLEYSEGKYLAFCECDDYWNDCRKLQKQYEAAEKHHAAFCVHQVRKVSEDRRPLAEKLPELKESFVKSSKEMIKNIFEAENINCFVYQGSSYFIKREILLQEPPEFVQVCDVGDVPMELLGATAGTTVYLAEEMSCYRVMSDSSWNRELMKSVIRQIEMQKNMMQCFWAYEKYTEHKYDALIESKITYIEQEIVRIRFEDLVIKRQFTKLNTSYCRKMREVLPLKEQIKFFLYGHCHIIMECYYKMKEIAKIILRRNKNKSNFM